LIYYKIKTYNNLDIWEQPIRKYFTDIEELLIQTLLVEFSINSKYREADLSLFSKTNDTKVYYKLIDFACKDVINNKYSSMILCGTESFGCGKTYALNALANYWFKKPRVSISTNKFNETTIVYGGINYHLIREEDLILRILATYKKEPKESEIDVYDELDKYDILGIDDIGKYAPNNLEFYRRVMFQIIDTRYNQGKGIILSTNFGLKELTKFFGVAISDRLNEMSKDFQIELTGKSFRNGESK
jgi:DNA replication protein DnaC